MSPKKKAARKKVAKKKAAKKKPAVKKKAAKMSSALTPRRFRAIGLQSRWFWRLSVDLARIIFPISVEKSVTVQFDDKGGINHPGAHRSTKDAVWFENQGEKKRTLTLSHWPFAQPAGPIIVPAHSTVGPFPLDPADPYVGTIHCFSAPAFDPSGPGDPAFDAGN